MIAPSSRCVLVFSLGFPIALLPTLVSPHLWTVWLAFVFSALVLAGADIILGLPRRRLTVSVTPPELLYIGDSDPLTLELSTPGWNQPTTFEVVISVGPNLHSPKPVVVVLSREGTAKAEVPLHAKRRGSADIRSIWLRWSGPMGLMNRMRQISLDESIAVTPNTRAVRSAALRFFSNREFLSGLKEQQFIGDGSDFDSLRDYLPGFDHRAIDWKASARHVKLLVREFRAERNHQVFLAFDTGHLMSEPMDGIPKLDHAINAGLLLGFVCLKTGERVGMYGFDDRVQLFLNAQGGIKNIHHLQSQSAQLEYGTSETNFTLGLTNLLSRLRRRSLVVVFTDFVDTVTAELMVDNIHRLSRRHLVIFVTFRDQLLDQFSGEKPASPTDLHRSVVAFDFLREREVVLRRLKRLGVFCIEAPTKRVPVQLINRYLEIKRRELV